MLKNLIGLVLAAGLGACASAYVGTPYERASTNIHRIAIADDSVPPKLTAWEVASAGSNFGLIGALVDAGIQGDREHEMTAALTSIGFDAEAALEQRLIATLGTEGYEAAVLPGSEREHRVFLTAYSGAPDGTDAYLDVVVTNYGYISAGVGQPWRPTAQALVRLVRASDNTTLMENQIVYNAMYVQQGVITITANPQFAFQNRDAMTADPQMLAAGLEDAFNQIADTAAHLLQ
jgi:hypothetical protein